MKGNVNMRTMLLAVASGIALSASTLALAADPQSTSSAAMAAPEPMAQSASVPQSVHTESQGPGAVQPVSATGEKLICHHPVHEGTVLPQEVCLTKHAWDLIRLREQKNLQDFQHRGFQTGMTR
jgi:hypothetical protein